MQIVEIGLLYIVERWNITWKHEVNGWMHDLDLGKRGVHAWIRKGVRLNFPGMINVNVQSW